MTIDRRDFVIAAVLITLVSLSFLLLVEMLAADPPTLPECDKGDVLVMERDDDDDDGERDYSCVTPREYP